MRFSLRKLIEQTRTMKRTLATILFAAAGFLGMAPLQAVAGSVQGNLYADANGNGKYDEGEEVPAKLTLFIFKDGKWQPVEANLTIENGRFVFEDVPDGTYRIKFEFEGGVVRTTQSFEVAGDKELTVGVPFAYDQGGDLLIPDTYNKGGESLSFVNLSAIVGEEVSTFKP